MNNEFVEIKFVSTQKGKGVFAKKDIIKGTTIERAPAILIPNKQFDLIQNTILYNYTFEWADPKNHGEYQNAMVLSFCEFINHSYDPNLKYSHDYKRKMIIFTSIRDIKKDEELTVNYNGRIDDQSPLWFKVD